MDLENGVSPRVRTRLADEALLVLDRIGPARDAVMEARLLMTRAAAAFIADQKGDGKRWDMRGMTFPFVMRDTGRVNENTLAELLPRFISELRARAKGGDYIFRDLCAEMCSFLSRRADSVAEQLNWLREAILFRTGVGPQKPLRFHTSRIAQAEDQLLVAHLTQDAQLRRTAIRSLAAADAEDLEDATSLTLVALEIEAHGALSGPLIEGDSDLAIAIRNGDTDAIFNAAAQTALRSQNTLRTTIGGRGTAQVVTDQHGVTGATFVYKTMTPLALERDLKRTQELAREIEEAQLVDEFGVIEHLGEFPSVQEELVISVRRFMSGATLHERLLEAEDAERVNLLSKAARYLAFMHSRKQSPSVVPEGVRKQLREQELGRWLRILGDGEHSVRFSLWMQQVATLPDVPRRDAHAHNWILGNDGKLLAVDLDSIGWRPLGYELAQLIDDFAYLDVTDEVGRRQITRAYLDGLSLGGVEVGIEQLETGLRAGQFARAVRAISDPGGTASTRNHGVELLDHLANVDDIVGRLSKVVAARWATLAGRSGSGGKAVTDATRHRLSRAMSYHLRHDRTALVNREGWMHIDELVAVLRAQGHRVTASQVLSIAGAMGEPRFECDGNEIRARYGHSIPIKIGYGAAIVPEVLYHATPLENLRSIVEAKDGLQRGARNWVHLSSDPKVAMGAARRQGRAVVLIAVRAAEVDDIVQAAPTTFLASRVPLEALSIVPLRRESSLQGVVGYGLTD